MKKELTGNFDLADFAGGLSVPEKIKDSATEQPAITEESKPTASTVVEAKKETKAGVGDPSPEAVPVPIAKKDRHRKKKAVKRKACATDTAPEVHPDHWGMIRENVAPPKLGLFSDPNCPDDLPSPAAIRQRKAARARRKKARGVDYIQSTVIFNPSMYEELDAVLSTVRRSSGINVSRSTLVRGLVRLYLQATAHGYRLDISDLFQPDPNDDTEMKVFQNCVTGKLQEILYQSMHALVKKKEDRPSTPTISRVG